MIKNGLPRPLTVSAPPAQLDDIDRRTVAALQADPRAPWSQLSGAIGVSESTAMRRVQRLRDSGALVIVAHPDTLKCKMGQPVLLRFRTVQGKAPLLARYLAERGDIRMVALLTGGNDVICELISPDQAHLARLLMFDLPETGAVLDSSTEVVLRTFKTHDQWSRDLLTPDRPIDAAPAGPAGEDAESEPAPLDDVDSRLLAALDPDARRSYSDLSAELGLSETAIARRLAALSSSGRLYFVAMVDPRTLGFELEVFLHLRVDLAELEATAKALAAMPTVRYLSATAGSSNLACEAIFRDTAALYEFFTGTLGSLAGIRQVDVDVELESVKRSFRYPLFGPHGGAAQES